MTEIEKLRDELKRTKRELAQAKNKIKMLNAALEPLRVKEIQFSRARDRIRSLEHNLEGIKERAKQKRRELHEVKKDYNSVHEILAQIVDEGKYE